MMYMHHLCFCLSVIFCSVSAWAHEQAVQRLRENKEASVADEPVTD